MLWFIHCIAGVDDRRGYVIFGRADQFGQFEVAPACDFWPRQKSSGCTEATEDVPGFCYRSGPSSAVFGKRKPRRNKCRNMNPSWRIEIWTIQCPGRRMQPHLVFGHDLNLRMTHWRVGNRDLEFAVPRAKKELPKSAPDILNGRAHSWSFMYRLFGWICVFIFSDDPPIL